MAREGHQGLRGRRARRGRRETWSEAHDIVPYLRGCVGVAEHAGGLVQPLRFFPKQLEQLDKAGRGHRSRATAGCAIDLVTDGDEVAFDCKVLRPLDRGHALYRLTCEQVGSLGTPEGGVIDGIDVMVAGRTRTLSVHDGTIRARFANPGHERLEVLVYLPCIMSVAIGRLRANGALAPAPRRDYLLALGDSITQGFTVGAPSRTYPARIAAGLGLDHVNQGVAGYVFDRRTLRGLAALKDMPPRVITVAYGTNDWTRKESRKKIRHDAEHYLEKLSWYFPDTPIYVLSPAWRADEDRVVPSGTSLAKVASSLRKICASHDGLTFVDMHDAYPHDELMLADGYLHPGAVAAQLMADRVIGEIRASGVAGFGKDGAGAGFAAGDGPAPELPRLDAADGKERAMAEGAGDVQESGKAAASDARTDSEDRASAARESGKPGASGAQGGGKASGMASAAEVAANAGDPDPAAVARDIDGQIAMRAGSPEEHPSWDRVVRMIWRLRQEDGCPWDKVQTHESITRDLIGEAYEAVDAIERHDVAGLREELGDVLEQVLLQSQIASDNGEFDIDDVCEGLDEKLIRRHPHVFGDVFGTGVAGDAATSGDVGALWDDVKKTEREAKGADTGDEPGLLDSIPISLPALMQAQKISKRAAKAGFEWDDLQGVWDKVEEEKGEFEAEPEGSDAAAMEFGDLLFALVNVARWHHIDAEAALEASNRKFRRRWSAMERLARERGASLEDLSTKDLNELWDQVKADE